MNVLITSVLIQVIISTLLALFFVKKKSKSAFLIVYILVVGVDFLFEYFLLYHFGQDLSYLSKFPGSFRMLKGPLLFLFTKRAIGRKIRNQEVLFHIMPFFIFFIYNVLVLILVFLDQNFDSKLVHGYGPIFRGFYFYYWLGYLMASLMIVFFFNKKKNDEIRYLKILLLFIVVSLLAYYLASVFFGLDPALGYKIYTYLFLVQFALILVLILKSNGPNSVRHTETKYQSTNLSENDYKNILSSIKETIKEKALHLDEELTLTKIAQESSISRHHITETLSVHLDTNFYDFINSYRIQQTLRLIMDDKSLRVTDVFYQSGFKSKSTFYKYFKSHTGVSPTEFKANTSRTIRKKQ